MKHNRFGAKKNTVSQSLAPILSAVFGLGILFFFVFAGNELETSTNNEQLQHLERAIRRSAVHCYATEGAYPQSLTYLKEHYAIVYDEERYLVNYQIFASNIMPEITVIARQQP